MKKIDTHQHFWRYDPVKDAWINNRMRVLKKDFLPQDLEQLLTEQEVEGCIAVQADQSEQENDFLLDCARQAPFIKGIVGWTDLCSDTLEERLHYFSGISLVKGFRHILQSEQDRALMLRPDFKRGIGLLSHYGFTYDLLIHPDQLLFARELALCFPDQRFILDHCAKPDIKSGNSIPWAQEIKLLAACPNVYCKLSGLITEAHWHTWTGNEIRPYLDTVTEAFGTGRLLFGSDWPVCLLAGQYTAVVRLLEDYLSPLPEAEQQAIWYSNARTCYNL